MLRSLPAALGLAASLAGPVASAQAVDAQGLIDRGVALREAGDDAGALEVFRRAWDATRSPRARAQMGLAEHALGRWSEADAHLREALDTNDPWVDRNRAPLESALAIVDEHIESPRPPPAAPRVSRGRGTSAGRVTSEGPAPLALSHPPAPASPLRALAWIAAGSSAALLAVSGATWFLHESAARRYNRGPCLGTAAPYAQETPGCQSDRDAAGTLEAVSTASVVGGVGLGVVSVVLFLVAPSRRELTTARLGCGRGPGELGVACGGWF